MIRSQKTTQSGTTIVHSLLQLLKNKLKATNCRSSKRMKLNQFTLETHHNSCRILSTFITSKNIKSSKITKPNVFSMKESFANYRPWLMTDDLPFTLGDSSYFLNYFFIGPIMTFGILFLNKYK